MTRDPATIDYASGATARPRSPDALGRLSVVLSAVAGGVGVLILTLFAITNVVGLKLIGLLWLVVGGLMTLYAFFLGVVYAGQVRQLREPPPAVRRRGRLAALLPIANLAIAATCVVVGQGLADFRRHALYLTNVGTTTIDIVTVVDGDGGYGGTTRTIVGLAPGERRRLHYADGEGGIVTITARARGREASQSHDYYEPTAPLDVRLVAP